MNFVMTDRGPVPEYWAVLQCIECPTLFHKNGDQVRCKPCGEAYRKRYFTERSRRLRAARKAGHV